MSTDVIKGSKISILILYRRRRFINHLITYLLITVIQMTMSEFLTTGSSNKVSTDDCINNAKPEIQYGHQNRKYLYLMNYDRLL